MGQIDLKETSTPETPASGRTGIYVDNTGAPRIIDDTGSTAPLGGAANFTDLLDVPSSYTGQGGKVVSVNVGETALEFITPAGGGTVTSVAISATDGLQVDSGSPITGAGTITLGVDAAALRTHINVADGATANTGTVTSVAISGTDGIEVDSGSPITGAGTITLGLNATTIKATAFPEAEERENDTVLFDKNYITGNTAVRTGNILFDFTGAKLGAVTRILHNSGTKPTIPSEGILISGSYTISVNNYIWFCITDIGSGTEKVEITVSQSSTW